MAIDSKSLTVDYRTLQAIPFRDRRALLYSSYADQINSSLTPGQRANLFPSYYARDAAAARSALTGASGTLGGSSAANRERTGAGVGFSDSNNVEGQSEKKGPPAITASEFRAVESNPFLAGYVDKTVRKEKTTTTGGVYKNDNERAKILVNKLLAAGLTRQAALSIAANNMQESGSKLNTTIKGDKNLSNPAVGIAQWREGRFENLKKFAKEQDRDWTDLETQIDFQIHEMKTLKPSRKGRGNIPGKDDDNFITALNAAQSEEEREKILRENYEVGIYDSKNYYAYLNQVQKGVFEETAETAESAPPPDAMSVVQKIVQEIPGANIYKSEGGKLLAEGDLEAIRYTGAPQTSTAATGYSSGKTTATKVKESYINNQFLGAADLMIGLGMWPGGENPYFSESSSGEYKFDPKGGVAIDPVHKGQGHYGFKGQLAYDIGVARLVQQAKDAGYDLSEADAHNVVVSMKDFLREQTGGAAGGSQEQKGKLGELYGPKRGSMVQGTGEAGHYRHFHYAPGINLQREDYNMMLQNLLNNPDVLKDPITGQSSKTSQRLLDDLQKAGFVKKNDNETYSRNDSIMPVQMKQSLGLDKPSVDMTNVAETPVTTPKSSTLNVDVQSSGMENYDPTQVSSNSIGAAKFGVTPEKKKKMIEEAKKAQTTPIKTMAQGGIVPSYGENEIVTRAPTSGEVIQRTKISEYGSEQVKVEPISKMKAEALTPAKNDVDVAPQMNEDQQKPPMQRSSMTASKVPSRPYSNITSEIKKPTATALRAALQIRMGNTSMGDYVA